MEVILLERVAKLGQMGETVRVKDGFARNFLLPRGKALRATEGNKKKLDGQSFIIIRQAGETGQLYGSVSARDIAETVTASGISVHRNQVTLLHPIKTLGLHKTPVHLHPEVSATVTVNVA